MERQQVGVTGLIPAHAGKTATSKRRSSPGPAHPRSRGENSMSDQMKPTFTGSSPLTRGKPREMMVHRAMRGLIPAHAGNTPVQQGALGLAAAHPRSRGENGEPSRCTSTRPGSSPLTRGKQTNAALAGPPGRLIPAHAGKTCSSRAAAALIAAHPRSRGENGRLAMRAFTGAGSSPLTRGKHEVSSFDLEMPGLIPAHAGKTSRPSILGPKVAAHPRSRGENSAN